MSSQKKQGKITIANLVAVVGFVLLLLFTYFGQSYLSGGEIGMDITISLIITGMFAFLLWMMIKAKGAENSLGAWKIVEFTTLGIYVVCIVLSVFFSGITHFFVVNSQKDDIKQCAFNDLAQIDSAFASYENFVEQSISKTAEGIRVAEGREQDDALRHWLENHNDADNYSQIQHNKLVGRTYQTFKSDCEAKSSEIKNAVKNWSVLRIPSRARMIEELGTSVAEELQKMLDGADLPKIDHNEAYTYTMKGSWKDNYTPKTEMTYTFRQALSDTKGFSIIALLIVLLIHTLILFNYVVAYRTSTVKIGREINEDGGRVL